MVEKIMMFIDGANIMKSANGKNKIDYIKLKNKVSKNKNLLEFFLMLKLHYLMLLINSFLLILDCFIILNNVPFLISYEEKYENLFVL